jgi:hypothetical protein
MDKRYQVFVSSTYADLKEERQAVIRTILEASCIPAGMELFPAADEEALAFIKRVIDDCDYYLLIIGGRYGSVSESGISYTEQEYEYAVGRGLNVIALIHGKPDDIPFGKSETDPSLRERLEKFKLKVRAGRLVKFWQNPAELPGLVALSLLNAVNSSPAVGWVRANKAANVEVLGEINELRKRNEWLETRLSQTKSALTAAMAPPALPDLAGLDEEIKVEGRYWSSYYNMNRDWYITTTWRKIFAYISPYLVSHPSSEAVKGVLGSALFDAAHVEGGATKVQYQSFDDQDFQTVGVQLRALGLVKIEYSETTTGGMGLFWSFTAKGEQLMVELRAVRSSLPKPVQKPISAK